VFFFFFFLILFDADQEARFSCIVELAWKFLFFFSFFFWGGGGGWVGVLFNISKFLFHLEKCNK
jgi:hypothetical protein